MIKILKTKTYNGMKDQINRLTKQILRQQNELSNLKNKMASLEGLYNVCSIENLKLKLENKRLKTILTKNKISYKKEGK